MTCIGPAAGSCGLLAIAYDASGQRVREATATVVRRFYGDTFVEILDTVTGDATYQILVMAFGEQIAMTELVQPSGARVVPLVVFGREVPPGALALPPALVLAWLLALALRGGLATGVARRPATAGLTAVLVVAIAIPPGLAWAGGGGYLEYHRWILSDRIGSGVAVLDQDGMLMRHTRFRPFSGVDAEVTPGARAGRRVYAGHPEQEETGLVQMQARWMDPETGVFVSVDPLVPDALNPQAFNAYAFAANNPVSLIDPDGLCARPGGSACMTPEYATVWSYPDAYSTSASVDAGTSAPPPPNPEGQGGGGDGTGGDGGGADSRPGQGAKDGQTVRWYVDDSGNLVVVVTSSAASSQGNGDAGVQLASASDGAETLPAEQTQEASIGPLRLLGWLLAKAAVRFAIRFPKTAALLGVGATAETLALARGEGASAGGKLINVVSPAIARTMNAVLVGRQPLVRCR